MNCRPRNIVVSTQRTTAEEFLILPSKKNWMGKAFGACVSATPSAKRSWAPLLLTHTRDCVVGRCVGVAAFILFRVVTWAATWFYSRGGGAQNRSSLVGPVDPHNRLVHILRRRDDAVAAQTLQEIGNYCAFANRSGTPYILGCSGTRRARAVAIRHKLRGLMLQTIEDREFSILDPRFKASRLR
jgi:hypothetical protein